ncbi:GNAT family N-acetyltransferase [Amycolatopsis suaedae]|uniref:GNAT family N-acetyltransferase n=1 Tax=Amycolatopsis suaedae TaxID=2510978 RepID=A0A4Q7J7H4_9PSEU|nr:GNAT family N-acetyltransferase [Amycolatopsis suaedae]RZQ61984.1 GNAT family N-acetyltransferase [Amycolatopsis suaedae]
MRLDELVGIPDTHLAPATPADCAELLVLQRCCWVQEALQNDTLDVPALHESLDDVLEWTSTWSTWCVRQGHRLVAAVRARLDGAVWEVGRLMVAPDLAGRGLGRWLLAYAEAQAPPGVTGFALFTGARSPRNITMYQRAGYRLAESAEVPGHIKGAVQLVKALPS